MDNLIASMLSVSDSDKVGLPCPPPASRPIAQAVDEAVAACFAQAPDLQTSDAYQCSRDRYTAVAQRILARLACGSRIAVGYAAPGHLPLLLENLGYEVEVFDRGDEWRSAYDPPHLSSRWPWQAANLEGARLPYATGALDCIVVSGAFERLLQRHPADVVAELRRVLKVGGLAVFSTPNICNVSNAVALLDGKNIFWSPDVFFAGTDRHNREFTPQEMRSFFEDGGFLAEDYFGVVDHANWRSGTAHHIYDFQSRHGDVDHALMRNTIVGVFSSSSN